MYVHVLHVYNVIHTDAFQYLHIHSAYTYIYMLTYAKTWAGTLTIHMRVDILQIRTDTY